MSKRLQVVLDDAEFGEVASAARREGVTVSHWVRQSLRQVRQERPETVRARKLAALRAARAHHHPTGDIEQLLAETERGY